MKRLYLIHQLWGQIFVDKDGNFVHYMHENDGNYRVEYMGRLIRFFSGDIVNLDVKIKDDGTGDIENNVAKYKTKISKAIEKLEY